MGRDQLRLLFGKALKRFPVALLATSCSFYMTRVSCRIGFRDAYTTWRQEFHRIHSLEDK